MRQLLCALTISAIGLAVFCSALHALPAQAAQAAQAAEPFSGVLEITLLEALVRDDRPEPLQRVNVVLHQADRAPSSGGAQVRRLQENWC